MQYTVVLHIPLKHILPYTPHYIIKSNHQRLSTLSLNLVAYKFICVSSSICSSIFFFNAIWLISSSNISTIKTVTLLIVISHLGRPMERFDLQQLIPGLKQVGHLQIAINLRENCVSGGQRPFIGGRGANVVPQFVCDGLSETALYPSEVAVIWDLITVLHELRQCLHCDLALCRVDLVGGYGIRSALGAQK